MFFFAVEGQGHFEQAGIGGRLALVNSMILDYIFNDRGRISF